MTTDPVNYTGKELAELLRSVTLDMQFPRVTVKYSWWTKAVTVTVYVENDHQLAMVQNNLRDRLHARRGIDYIRGSGIINRVHWRRG